MKTSHNAEWIRLDNASKIFPATCDNRDTKVFRISCELYEPVEAGLLQHALDRAIEAFPLYRSVLRRGVFWYYLESTNLRPEAAEESLPICAPLYIGDRRNLLFRVFYFGRRISLEVFHALSDGTGALWFMEALVHHYLVLRHGEAWPGAAPDYRHRSAVSGQKDDSFQRHFRREGWFRPGEKRPSRPRPTRAYRIRVRPSGDNRTHLVEGTVSTAALLDKAHVYGTTMTVFVTALFLQAIGKDMPAARRNRPVVLSVPLDLRQYYESATARNFFTTINVSYKFGNAPEAAAGAGSTAADPAGDTLSDIIAGVKESFRESRDQERLKDHLHQLLSLEQNPFTRLLPLPLKDLSLQIAYGIRGRRYTSILSNIGRVTMPEELQPYIRQFSICTSAKMPKITMCTYLDRTVVSFTSPSADTEIQRLFFRELARMGLAVEVATNL